MSSLNYMSLRDFEFFSFFLEILCFFVPHYTRQILQKIDTKRNDHVFPKLNEPSWFLQIFVLENNVFNISYFCFPIDTSMKLLITWFSKFHICFPIDTPLKPISRVMKNSGIGGLNNADSFWLSFSTKIN